MSHSAARLLYWSPRIVTLAFAIFLSLFALESFQEAHGFWHLALAFAVNLVPALIVVVVLLAAWRWEWMGAVAFAGLAVWYSWSMLHRHHLTWPIFMGIPFPLLAIAGLFLANWFERARRRERP
ncbi:MAG TPA: hypothetical protein VL990_11125 [Acidobacteriaceae bacterium]|nr:hypothetical protein [Acidobacteriaceae bacterium]